MEMIGCYQIDNIYNCDCYKVIKNVPNSSVDLVILDPPYKMDSRGGGFHKKRDYYDVINQKGMTQGLDDSLLKELERVMKKTNIYIFCNKNQLRQLFNFYENKNIDLLIWHKTNVIPTINNKYLSDIEYIFFARDKGVKVYGSYETLSKCIETTTNKIDKARYMHPTIKPVNIMKKLIINSSCEGDVVLDCFSGSGTTAVASQELKRHFICFERDKIYYDISQDRLNQLNANGQQSMFCI